MTLRQLSPVPWSRVRIEGGFWGPRVETNRAVTLPLEFELNNKTKVLETVTLHVEPTGPEAKRRVADHWDGDLYRTERTPHETVPITAGAYCLCGNRDPGEMQVWIRGE